MRQVAEPQTVASQYGLSAGRARASYGHAHGFTLLELLVVISIASILVLIAVPSFVDSTQRTNRNAAVTALADAISVARSEALGRGTATVLCASSTGTGCTAGADWNVGFLVAETQSGDVLQVWQTLPDTMSVWLETTGDADKLFFQADGMTYKNSTYVVCDDSGDANARALVVGYSGLSRIAVDSGDDDQTVENHTGNDVECPSA